MNLRGIDVSRCNRPEKVEIEGFCLSFDLMRGLCLETMGPCVAQVEEAEEEHGD